MSGHGNWRRPSGCANTECVEVRVFADEVHVGRSDSVPTIVYTRAEWAVFVAAVKAGEYDAETLT